MRKDLYSIKIGLVLAGGGAKGAYEVGVYKALKELALVENIKVISGTSIGAINALFFAMDDLKVINTSWSNLNYSRFLLNEEKTRSKKVPALLEKIKSINTEEKIFEQISLSDIGLLSQAGVKNFIEEYIKIDVIKKCGKEIYACAYNIDMERSEYFKLNDCNEEEIKERVLASCAIPHMFKPIVIDDMRYADGGIHSPLYSKNNVDNIPINPLRGYNCDIIIVVHLSYKNRIDRKGFDSTNIIEIYPSSPLEILNGIGTINIKKETIENSMELGYRDAMVILAPMIINILKRKSIKSLIEKNNENNKKLILTRN
ncbi:patatin-like phospholipase family protein [Clostridium sp. AL.422]|uniref:patatin-like phospholipase family protein n=1 Tax=Clostridium TaxID=1485 RepID=UPI00293DEBF0|nr:MULTISPECIES: patatin-like phospholipase family protein [unclassified Clostridium]MDV4152072.1 patatin-like phospholipase family protein [Clostridium sp. AL.422]